MVKNSSAKWSQLKFLSGLYFHVRKYIVKTFQKSLGFWPISDCLEHSLKKFMSCYARWPKTPKVGPKHLIKCVSTPRTCLRSGKLLVFLAREREALKVAFFFLSLLFV